MRKLKEKLFLKEYDEEKIKIANKTARASGASALNKDGSIRSVVGRYVLDNVSKDASILDFGSGPAAVQTLALRDAGFKNVSAYDFGVNTRDGIQDPDALNKKYDVVFASNVLNVSSDEEMLRETLRDIKKAAKNEIVFNYPSSPRKSGLNAQEVKDIIIDEYGVEPELVSGTKSAPVWKVLLNSSKNISEDTVKTRDGKWTNRGDSGETHGEFRTKKQADAQRKAIYASGWKKESVEDLANRVRKNDLEWDDEIEASYAEDGDVAVQFQDRETLTHEVTPYRSRRPRVSSNTWGRIWKDGNLVYNERGPKYKVRDDIIKKLNSMNESFESDLERKLVRMWFNEDQAAWLVKHDPETAEWLAYGNIRTQDLIDVEREINQKMAVKLIESVESTEFYGVFEKGGSIGKSYANRDDLHVWSGRDAGTLVKVFSSSDEAKNYAKRRRSMLSPGERSYYGMGYFVKRLSKKDLEHPQVIDMISNMPGSSASQVAESLTESDDVWSTPESAAKSLFDRGLVASDYVERACKRHGKDNNFAHEVEVIIDQMIEEDEHLGESKSINEVNEGIDGWDNRTGVIKRIDKYLHDNPEAAPPKGYIQKGSRAYYDAVNRYGNYVTTPFGNISTDDLMQYARENGLLINQKMGLKEDWVSVEEDPVNEDAQNKNSYKYFALMSYDFDPESGPDADSFSVIDIGQFSSKKEAEDNWRDILSEDQWAYVTEISEDEYNDHQELIKFYNEHPGYMDYEYCTKVVNQFKDALRSKDQEGARAARKELSSIGYSNEEISAIKKEVLKEAFNADRVQKRIACTTEFDNGHVFHNDYFRASSAEAEEMARQKSIENPGKVFYVKYDNVMEPCSDIKWKNGQKINESKSTDLEDDIYDDDKIYYHGFIDKKDVDRHYPDRLKTKTYWYSTRHGVMPGSVPKGINILDVRDIGNKSYFKTDSIISSKDLKYYDIKEDVPPMEESKRFSKKYSKLLKENAYIKTYKLGDPEFENLYKLADILTRKSPNKYVYYVGDTYFDLGQNWMWTTVLCRGGWSSYQALSPREQEEAILAKSDAELEKIADSVLSDKYCPDKKRISEDAIADKIKANQDTKEMTKRAIQILKKKGAEYKDLEKEYEKIYGDKLIFDEK